MSASIKRTILEFNERHSIQAVETRRSVSPAATEINSASNIRLPKLDLPKFSGKYEDWFPFYEMFSAAINDNRSLSNFHKFQYLKASITGDAANIIKSLELSEQNYQVAWNLMRQRYDNKRAIVEVHLRALFRFAHAS